MFPCWDEPALKATFNVSIKHHRDYIFLSNMLVRKIEIIENDMLWTHFDTTPAILAYFVAAVRIEQTTSYSLLLGGTDIVLWSRPYVYYNTLYAQEVIKNINLYLEGKWKNLKLISKINHIVILNFQDEGMGNLGFIFYR